MSSSNTSATGKSSGKCNRSNPPCKYLHPTQHLRDVLIQNGRNNLILRSIAMNLAANPTIYPPTAIPSPYANGAILPQTLPQTATLGPYHHLTGSATNAAAPSTLVFNQAGQAFSIPIQSLHQGAAMYAPDGTSYFSPMTQLATATGPGPKTTRTDRLESYLDPFYASATVHDDDGGNFHNGYLSAYQTYPGALQTIYTTDIKEPTLITGNANVSASQEIKAVDLGSNSSSSSNASQTKKRPLEDDTAPPTGAYLQLPPGTQILATAAAPPQYLHPGTNSTSATQQQQQQQQQKRSAIADPKTGIPVAAYPVPTFSYPSTSSLPIQFQPSYLTAVPMAFTGYSPHLPRL